MLSTCHVNLHSQTYLSFFFHHTVNEAALIPSVEGFVRQDRSPRVTSPEFKFQYAIRSHNGAWL